MAPIRHILEAQQFDRPYLDRLFAQATKLGKDPQPLLTGKILATLFYEPSTRTRLSFESAMHRLDGGVISTPDAEAQSSAVKGETIEDTARIVSNYADVIVMRHGEPGSVARAAAVSSVPVINAGDGGKGQHPTQALLDVYTIQKELGTPDGKIIAFAGALKFYRASRSLAILLTLYKPAKFIFVSPPELAMLDDVKRVVSDAGIPFVDTDDYEATVKEADVLYQNRIPKEYFDAPDEYETYKGRFVLTRKIVDTMKDHAVVMHPLPRIDEIVPEVDDSPHAAYFRQSAYGVHVRMALLADLLT